MALPEPAANRRRLSQHRLRNDDNNKITILPHGPEARGANGSNKLGKWDNFVSRRFRGFSHETSRETLRKLYLCGFFIHNT